MHISVMGLKVKEREGKGWEEKINILLLFRENHKGFC